MAELTPEQSRFIRWKATPEKERNPSTMETLSQLMGVDTDTLRRWSHTAWFRDELQREYVALNASPERMQAVVEALWKEARSGDVSAATKYLDYLRSIGAFSGQVEERGVEDMTDDELQEAWESQFSGI